MSAFPPLQTQPGLAISPEIALQFLSKYLTEAKSTPYLLPNARLEGSGPTAGPSNSSITIHNLQRVEAGLRGEWLAPKLDLEEGNAREEGTNNETRDGKEGGQQEEGWMDLEEYQREQSVEGPEQAQEEIGIEDGDDVEEGPHHAAFEGGEEAVTLPMMKAKRKHEEIEDVKTFKAPMDVEARKKEKKARLKAEKKAKEEARKRESQKTA